MVSMFKRKGSAKYILAWKDANGRRREKVAFRDKRASEQLKAKIERELELGQAGLLDPYRDHRQAPIAEHVDAYVTMLESRGRTAKHIAHTRRHLERAIASMGATRLEDLTPAAADTFLRDLRKTLSARSRDHYGDTLRSWGAWLVDEDRWPENPFRRVTRIATDGDATFERRALTHEELAAVCAAAPVRAIQTYASTHPRAKPETLARLRRLGEQRALLYWFAAYTGLRAAECRAVRWADLELDGVAHVTVRGATAKNRRTQRVPLHADLVALLRAERLRQAREAGRPVRGSEAALHVPQTIVKRLRLDAAWAGLEDDELQRRLDFHSLRATCATLLVRSGVDLGRAAEILRHSDPKLTKKVYTKLGLEDAADGVAKLPGVPVQNHVREGDGAGLPEPVRDTHDDNTKEASRGSETA